MLEITGFITDCFNNGDLLEKFTLQFDDENIEVDLKNSSIEKIIGGGNICELWLNRVELICKSSSTTLSLQKNTTQSHKLRNDQGKTMIAKDSFVPLL